MPASLALRTRSPLAALVTAAALAVGGCGDDGGGSGGAGTTGATGAGGDDTATTSGTGGSTATSTGSSTTSTGPTSGTGGTGGASSGSDGTGGGGQGGAGQGGDGGAGQGGDGQGGASALPACEAYRDVYVDTAADLDCSNAEVESPAYCDQFEADPCLVERTAYWECATDAIPDASCSCVEYDGQLLLICDVCAAERDALTGCSVE